MATPSIAYSLAAACAGAAVALIVQHVLLVRASHFFPELDSTEVVHGTPQRSSRQRAGAAVVPDSARPTGGASVARFGRSGSVGSVGSTGAARGLKVPVIMGVAGASGSGKTSIASLVAERLHGMRVVRSGCSRVVRRLRPLGGEASPSPLSSAS